MFGQDFSTGAIAAAGTTQVQPSRPPPEQRVVEDVARSRLQQHQTGSMYARLPSAIKQLASSARQFADVLDTTGNIQVASVVSGFRAGQLDVYA